MHIRDKKKTPSQNLKKHRADQRGKTHNHERQTTTHKKHTTPYIENKKKNKKKTKGKTNQ